MSGQATIVTGATSGLSRAVALRLAAEGAHITLVGRREDDLERVARRTRLGAGHLHQDWNRVVAVTLTAPSPWPGR